MRAGVGGVPESLVCPAFPLIGVLGAGLVSGCGGWAVADGLVPQPQPGGRPVGFQYSAARADQRLQAARSYSLINPPRTGRRLILWVPESLSVSSDLPILVEEAADAVVSLDLVDLGWCAMRERA
jgi:hypothetical protein